MRRAIIPIAIYVICALAASLAAGRTAVAQAGSAGGTLGKTDKSAGGGRETAEPAKPLRVVQPKQKDTAAVAKPQDAVSVAGRWHWTADCNNGGHYAAGFQLTQGMAGEFNGVFVQDLGTITDGHVNNGVISFTRNGGFYTQHWTGQLGEGGTHINGSLTGNVNCTWEGRKE
jgi:hypothetical protein